MDRIRRLADEHRRLLAAACAALAVLAALSAVRQSPETVTIAVARHDLASGTVVSAGDIGSAALPRSAVPDHVLPRHRAVGRRVAGPMRAGEALTDARLVGPGSLHGYGAGAVLTTVRVERADAATLAAGDRVDVVAVAPGGESPAEIVARDVEVVTVPDEADADRAEAAALGVVTTEEGALALAQAGLSSRLTVITSSG